MASDAVRKAVISIVPVPLAEAMVSLYASEPKVQVRSVQGWFATRRWVMVWLTQLLFSGLPWLP